MLASFLFVATVSVAAFDAGRFHWSPALPAVVRITCLVLLAFSWSLQVWAIAVNPFFSPRLSVRPDHRLVTCGPYRFIRHPGYLAMLVTMPATAVTLGSLAALLPALGYDLFILNRTMREMRNIPLAPGCFSDMLLAIRSVTSAGPGLLPVLLRNWRTHKASRHASSMIYVEPECATSFALVCLKALP